MSNFKYKRASLVHSELLEKEVSIFVASAVGYQSNEVLLLSVEAALGIIFS